METFAYLIRVNIAIVVCYAAYRIFFRNDTFFAGKRILLISLLLLSFAYPFLSLGNLRDLATRGYARPAGTFARYVAR
jgi:hypothetical protein